MKKLFKRLFRGLSLIELLICLLLALVLSTVAVHAGIGRGYFERPLPLPKRPQSALELRLSVLSERLSGRPTHVWCGGDPNDKVWGQTDLRRHNILLDTALCAELVSSAAELKGYSVADCRQNGYACAFYLLGAADSASVLAHESGHMRRGTSESQAECFALAHIEPLLRMLQASPFAAQAAAIADYHWLHSELPSKYGGRCSKETARQHGLESLSFRYQGLLVTLPSYSGVADGKPATVKP